MWAEKSLRALILWLDLPKPFFDAQGLVAEIEGLKLNLIALLEFSEVLAVGPFTLHLASAYTISQLLNQHTHSQSIW